VAEGLGQARGDGRWRLAAGDADATELERAEMVQRERDDDDRRRVLLRVNPRPAEFIVERRITPMRRMMAALDSGERAALIKALGLFADEIERRAQ
jgi:DNA-binding MarR family transcriptional regulator